MREQNPVVGKIHCRCWFKIFTKEKKVVTYYFYCSVHVATNSNVSVIAAFTGFTTVGLHVAGVGITFPIGGPVGTVIMVVVTLGICNHKGKWFYLFLKFGLCVKKHWLLHSCLKHENIFLVPQRDGLSA